MGASQKPKLIHGFQSRRLKQGVNFGGVRSTCVTKFFIKSNLIFFCQQSQKSFLYVSPEEYSILYLYLKRK